MLPCAVRRANDFMAVIRSRRVQLRHFHCGLSLLQRHHGEDTAAVGVEPSALMCRVQRGQDVAYALAS